MIQVPIRQRVNDEILPTDRLTVACVLRSGGPYDRRYVLELAHGLLANMHRDFDMVCLTDMPREVAGICTAIPLKHDWPGWWAKIELFRLVGDVIYFDLDTVIKWNISEFADRQSAPFDFAMLEDFNVPTWSQSSVMAWNGDFRYLYEGFKVQDIDSSPRGDQQYIGQRVTHGFLQMMYPGLFASYKRSIPVDKEQASVICFHGQPRPHHVDWDWR